MDNLAVYKMAGVSDVIRATGASILYLPPYSSDPNAIEQVFAKLKALLRKAEARTKDALWTTISELLGQFSPAECHNYLVKSGYGSMQYENALSLENPLLKIGFQRLRLWRIPRAEPLACYLADVGLKLAPGTSPAGG